MTAETTIQGLRDLDPEIISQIHATYFPIVFRYIRYRISDEALAEDLASETFIRLLEAVHAGRGPKSSLRGWLFGTASNLVNDYFRTVYRTPIIAISENHPASNGNPVSHAEQIDQRAELQEALRQLTADQQHVLALRFGSGCSLAETADIMQKKPNAVKQLQFRALAALKRNLAGDCQ